MQRHSLKMAAANFRSVVSHVSWSGAKLGVGLDHFIHSVQEVLLRGNLHQSKKTFNVKVEIELKYLRTSQHLLLAQSHTQSQKRSH